MSKNNLAILRPVPQVDSDSEFKDGDDGNESITVVNIIVHITDNGYVVRTEFSNDTITENVYLFNVDGELGPQGALEEVMHNMGVEGMYIGFQ